MNLSGITPRCPVCFELLDQDHVFTLPCGHAFDHSCILSWLAKSPTCPCCRAPADAGQLMKVHFDFPTPIERQVASEAPEHAAMVEPMLANVDGRVAKRQEEPQTATSAVIE
ncbi:zinc finger protein, partial [Aphelenchoides avenae]